MEQRNSGETATIDSVCSNGEGTGVGCQRYREHKAVAAVRSDNVRSDLRPMLFDGNTSVERIPPLDLPSPGTSQWQPFDY